MNTALALKADKDDPTFTTGITLTKPVVAQQFWTQNSQLFQFTNNTKCISIPIVPQYNVADRRNFVVEWTTDKITAQSTIMSTCYLVDLFFTGDNPAGGNPFISSKLHTNGSTQYAKIKVTVYDGHDYSSGPNTAVAMYLNLVIM